MKKPKSITTEEAEILLSHMLPREEVITRIMIESGLRITDVLNIKAENITEAIPVVERKTGKLKKLDISYFTTDRIYTYTDGRKQGLIFPNKKNPERAINRSTYFRVLKRIAGKENIDVSPHSFRKLYARNLWLKTKNIYLVQAHLNHKYVETTARYLDIDIERLIIENLS